MAESTSRFRLTESVRPTLYELWLTPNLEAATFEGRVKIHVNVAEPTEELILNAAELEILPGMTVELSDGTSEENLNWSLDEVTETLIIVPNRTIQPGTLNLFISFKGVHNDRMVGFYRSKYKKADGTPACWVSTQFEAHHARRCFPCFDEPSFKAEFDVTIDVPTGCTALANTPVSTTTGGRVWFSRSPVMSTYLLAFAVGEMEAISEKMADGTELKVWTTPGKAEQGRFALDVTRRCLEFYNEYFGIAYGSVLPKLDQLAVPDFSFGAMENWGLITYREVCLLTTDGTSEATRQRVAEVICHELAHQWFGNLVTMKWWDNLWLNESFATWMANRALQELFPEWDVWPEFIASEMTSAMSLDGRCTTHAIEVPVPRAQDIDEIFDAISYSKGGCVLRMLEKYVGADNFRDGLRLYMQRHQFINTVSADLWNAIGEASGEASGDPGIPALVRAWTSQPGFPLVEVCRCRHGLGLELSQTHYRIDGQADDQGKTWPIPLRLQADGEERSLVLDAPRMTVPLINAAGLRVNVDRMSFCRVAYDETLFTELMLDLSEGRLTSIEERFALQDDARALAASGQRPITTFLEVCKANRAETEYSVWNGMLTGLNSIDGYLAWDGEDGGNPVIDQFVLTVIEDALARVGLIAQDGESAMTVKLRSMLANAAMAHGHRPTVDALIAMLASGATIDPNLRPAVYGAVARHHGAVGFEMLLARYRLEKDVEEKLRLLRALGRTSDLKLKRRALEFAFSSEVRAQDAYSGVASVAGTPAGIRLAWEFVKERWAFICERHQGNNAKIGYYLGVSEWLATPELLEDAKVFIEANPIEGLSMSAKQAIERIELNLQWRARNSAAAAAWLKDEFTL